MDGLKPIIPGCRVMYIGRDLSQVGSTGVATRFIPASKDERTVIDGRGYYLDLDSWVVVWDKLFKPTGINSVTGKYDSRPPSYELPMAVIALMRIDGDVDEESDADEISKVKELAHGE